MVSACRPACIPLARLLLGSALVAVFCVSALLATSPGLPMAWDEGDAILRAEAIPHQWQYTTQREGHPALYGMVIAAGRWISGGWLGPLDAARFGPMMLFGVAAGAMFYRMWRDYSAVAAAAAVGALLLLPRMFAHAHFASLDGPLTSCWVLAWATFPPAASKAAAGTSWRRAAFWGIVLGMTFSCKATGWIAPLPFLVWALIYRDRAAAKTLAVGVPVAVLTFFALNPPLWGDPLYGWVEFFQLNLNRAGRLKLNIPVRFLGQSYHLGNPLPWYNTLLWTAVTVPVGTLFLAVIGIVAVTWRCRSDRAGILLAANWLVLLIVRALPMTPPHDGVRLFLPSFAFLAALAGVGCAEVLAWASHRWPQGVEGSQNTARSSPRLALRWQQTQEGDEPHGSLVFVKRPLIWGVLALIRRLTFAALGLIYRSSLVAALVLIYAGSASSLFWYAPQWLSYYSLLIGGLPGATAAGMEPTYYWDALDRSVLDWLEANTGQHEKIYFGSGSAENLRLMRQWGRLGRGTQFDAQPGQFRWYVMQHRPGPWPWWPIDPWLIEHCRPAYRQTIRPPALRGVLQGWGLDVPRPWRLDVPLVEVYHYQQYLRARRATGGCDIGPEGSP
jgi:4-amino-4-deoxy-L-arabinose transferase-like glycosyltransferase